MKAKQGIRHQHFASLAEFIAFGERDCKRSENVRQKTALESASTWTTPQQWYGVASLDAVKAALNEGWQEGADAIEEMYVKMAAALPRAIDVRRHRVRSDQGEELDIHAVYRGDLSRAWSHTTRALRHGTSLVRIVVDVCDNSGVRAEQLRWRGVGALALSRILQRAGYSVEIVAALAGQNAAVDKRGDKAMQSVVVKPRHVVQDSRLLAATVSLPGFFRYYGFKAIIQAADDDGYITDSGLGSALRVDSTVEADPRVLQTVTPAMSRAADVEEWIKTTVRLFQQANISKEGR